jgi:uncharacterized protein YndB with AHSA1/START domain
MDVAVRCCDNISQPNPPMTKLILLAIAVVIALFLIIVALRPGDFKIERSVLISAPPELVFEQVNDLHQFQKWSPWAKMDPDAKTTFSGPPAGVGSAFGWDGEKTGAGTMTLTESKPTELVRFRLDFTKPFKGTNLAQFTIRPEGDQTRLNWAMTGKYNFVMKAAGMFMDCDKMIGDQFEQGLGFLKSIAEAPGR